MRSPDALLCDMNGLFRHWRNAGARAGETAAGLPTGTLDVYAYQHPSYDEAKVGILTDQEWADDVQGRLVNDFGPHAKAAIPPWRADRGEVDAVMVDLLGQARQHLPVAVLSNCTNALHSDLAHHGIEFDFVFPSADIGAVKPTPQAYLTAASRMGVAPERLYFFDDQEAFVAGAVGAGLDGELFIGAAAFAKTLDRLGIKVAFP
ncbi:HAD-IA family hydrolase [Microtetraspora malaysiensis]|uniref:HAD-IA family hydrolase n=1 Tax=Microtetraspora malaysiensis TaxID=161358 RepID=A0ABW6T2W0_9ACTN